MSWLKRIHHVCEECSSEAKEHVLEYNTVTQENKNYWYCGIHQPEWSVKYIPANTFKKIIHKSGINFVETCNENGELCHG